MKAVEKLGYVPNSIASSLRAGHSKTVAIVFDDLINPFYSVMTLSIGRTLAQSCYDVMMFSNYGVSSFLDFALFNKIVARKIDAVVSFLEPQPDLVETIVNSEIPFLPVGRTVNDKRIDALYSDDVVGGRKADRPSDRARAQKNRLHRRSSGSQRRQSPFYGLLPIAQNARHRISTRIRCLFFRFSYL